MSSFASLFCCCFCLAQTSRDELENTVRLSNLVMQCDECLRVYGNCAYSTAGGMLRDLFITDRV